MSSTSGNSVVSVASSTSAGAAGGSVINVSQLVGQLVQATAAPQQSLLNTQTTAVTTQISALGTLKSALSTFQTSLTSLATPSQFNAESATSNNQTAFTATTTTGAPVGAYSVTVTKLASAQQLKSSAFTAGANAVVGTGALKLSVGGQSFSVNIDGTNNTLAGIASAINTAAGNTGVQATVLQGKDGAHLLLSSSVTGAANTLSVTETDGGSALSALTYDTASSNTSNYTEVAPAQDAEYSISGVDASSPSNTITDALNGVTLTLLGKTPTDTPATLTVATNTNQIESNIAAFVSAYNTLAGSFKSLGGYDSTTGSAGPMMGDALLSSIQNGIRGSLYNVVDTGSSVYNSLASIGITSNQDGTLTLDNNKLQTALQSNFNAVSQLFSGTSGVATTLNTQLTADLGAKGVIAQNSTTLVNQENALTQKGTDLNNQMTALSASLTQQYSSLNTLLSSLQTTSAYLTQAFNSLPSNRNTSSS
jgi:flagellar hook-associated protein 2